MTGVVEIRDTTRDSPGGPRVLAPTLAELLECVASIGRDLTWTVLDLEAVGELGEGRNMLDLEAQIQASPHGLVVSWSELLTLAQELHQVISGVLAGVKDPSATARIWRGTDSCAISDLVLEAIDSSLWSVYARDDRVLQRLQGRFHDISFLTIPVRHAR